jgi:ferredoxin-nitrate reductase
MTTNSTKTLCPYCGVGCGLEVLPPAVPGEAVKRDKDGNLLWKVIGDKSHPSTHGMICVKGATLGEVLDRDRLKYPMVRESLDAPFRRATWDEALDLIVSKLKDTIADRGPDGICMYGSGQFQTEDYYIAQKLLKGCLGTNNFDANSRLCMSSAVSGYIQSLGSDGPPACYDDLELTDCAFIIGANAADCHPIIFNRFAKYHRKHPNVKLIVVDPRRTKTAEAADLHLAIRPGTDIDLMNGMAYLLWQWGQIDRPFIDEHTAGFASYEDVLRHYAPPIVAHRCGIDIDDLITAARYWGESKRVLSMWSMGVNQSTEGTAKVRTIINLHLMTGQIGRPGAGPFSLTGQPNAMGGREAGGLSHLLPGYRLVKNADQRREVEAFWGLPEGRIAPQPGLSVWQMIEAIERDEVGVFWVAATNPAVSLPDIERTKAALGRSPFTIYQDAYYPTETAAYAHVLLPAAQWGEKTGVMTNSERRVTLCSSFRPAAGLARADWQIFAEVGRRLGFAEQFAFVSPAQVYDEFVLLTQGRVCDMAGLSHDRLRTEGPQQWPMPLACDLPDRGQKGWWKLLQEPIGKSSNSGKKAAKRLYETHIFATADGRARFGAFHSKGLAEPADAQYPFVFTNGRLYEHWHTQTRTGRIEKIRKLYDHAFVEIHPRDAFNLRIETGDWVELRSRRGHARFVARVTKAICPGTLFAPMHWGALWAEQSEVNALTHPEACPDSGEPELKACAIQVIAVKQLDQGLEASEDTTVPGLAPDLALSSVAQVSVAQVSIAQVNDVSILSV